MSQRPGITNVGIEYQYKVITYTAACLSENHDVDNFTISSNLEDVPLFDDLVVEVSFKDNKFKPHCYLGQIKHKSNKSDPIALDQKKHNLDEYLQRIKEIIAKKKNIKVLRNIEEDNVVFWFFTNNTIKDTLSTKEGTYVKQLQKCNFVFHPTVSTCHKLILESGMNNPNMDKLHFILDQSNNDEIQAKINKLCFDGGSDEMTDNLINFVDKNFKANTGYLTKRAFEIEVLRIRLSNVIAKPTLAVEINEEHARLWNTITSNHEITVIEREPNMKKNIFGCFWSKINNIINCEIDWNNYIDTGGTIKSLERKVEDYLKSKRERQWNIVPDCIGTLVEIMWKYDDLPLLLETSDTTLLQKYKHLKKRFIVIGDVKKICNQMREFPRKIFTDVASIQSDDLRNHLLRKIIVSLQGRKPTPIYNIVLDNEEAMRELTCSIILRLIKKRSLFLGKNLLGNSTFKIIYIIVADEIESEYDFEEIDYESSIVIKCTDFEKMKEKIKTHPKLQRYKQCHILLSDDKYEPLIPDQIHEEIKNFAVDQDGEGIYGFGDHRLAPVVGERLKSSKPNYIQRRLSFRRRKFEECKLFEQNLNPIIISGEPGIGKSSLLVSLAEKYDENSYVLFCDLSNYRSELKGNTKELRQSPLDFIFGKSEKLIYKKLLKKVYEHQWKNGKLILFLDSFDEILPCYKEKVLLILDKISKINVKFVISSRTHANHILEEKLGMAPMWIEQLDRKDAEKYLQKENITEINFKRIPGQFFESPLYLQFLILLLLEDSSNFTEIDTFDLYKKFIYKKVERYYKKYKQDYNPDLEALIRSTLKWHRLLALIAIFREEALEKPRIKKEYETLTKDLKENECKIGFIKYFDEHGFPVFSHETFAEFLTVEWIVENIEEKSALEIYKQTISGWNYDFRNFFDSMLCKDLKLHQAILKLDVKLVSELCAERDNLREVDRFGRTALHLVSSYWAEHYLFDVDPADIHRILDIIVGCMRKVDIGRRDSIMEWSWVESIFKCNNCGRTYEEFLAKELFDAVRYNLKNYVEYLLNVEKTSINNDSEFPLLLVAAQSSTVDIVKSLIARGADIAITDSDSRTVLHYAAQNNRPDVIKYFLDLCLTNINHINDHGKTALHVACSYKNFNAIAALLDKGADPNITDEDGRNALLRFISRLDVYTEDVFLIIDKFIEYNINLRQKDNSGDRVLHYVSRHDSKDLFSYFLKKLGVKSLFNTNNLRETPFHVACKEGCITLVKYLVEEHRGLLTSVDNFGNTCLHYAASYRNNSVLSILLDKRGYGGNTNLEIRNYSGDTLLHTSVGFDSYDVTEFLLRIGHDPNLVDGNGNTVLLKAILNQSPSLVALLLSKGADINVKDIIGLTPLELAIMNYNRAIVDVILDYCEHFDPSLDLTKKFTSGNTLLHYACENDHKNAVDYLLKNMRKDDIHIQNERGKTPFHIACEKGRSEIVEALLDYSPEVLELDKEGNTCLHLAVKYGEERVFFILAGKMDLTGNDSFELRNNLDETPLHISAQWSSFITEFLLGRGHDPNVLDKDRNTPLHWAARENSSAIHVLIQKGANIVARNKDLQTPLHQAVKLPKSYKSVRMLLENGADVNAKDVDGNTPLHICLMNEHYRPDTWRSLIRFGADLKITNKKNKTPLKVAKLHNKDDFLLDLTKKG